MLGKQWLNRYGSTDKRGSAIERSQNRQRKLDGIVTWGFDYVMESLPLMLQIALLLLCCALSRYLWEIDITIALVVLCVTSFGTIFYLLIVAAGTASESCPYQTPCSHSLRYVLHHVLPALRSAPSVVFTLVPSRFSNMIRMSWCYIVLNNWWQVMERPWYSMRNIIHTLQAPFLLIALVADTFSLGQVMLQSLVTFYRTAYRRYLYASAPRTHGSVQQAITSDLRCVSWILQTSLDKDFHLSTFKYILSLSELSHFHPSIVIDCFNVFINCISFNDCKAGIVQGLERLATASAAGFFHTFHNLTLMDPTSSVLEEIHQRYSTIFPPEADFTDLPFRSTMAAIHTLTSRFGNPHQVWIENNRRTSPEYTPFSQRMARAALAGYQRTQDGKVPRWILRSALHFLSLGSLSPAFVVADCLTIIAIDMGCSTSDAANSDDRCVYVCRIFTRLTKSQRTN